MYKRIKGKKFGRETDQRRAFMRALAVNLIMKEKIETTKVRARQVAALVERLVTKARGKNLAAQKALVAALPSPARQKLMAEIAPRFIGRPGGYTRVVKLGQRAKDGAPMAIVEFVDRPAAEAKKETKKEAKKQSKKQSEKAKP